jgi:hypothetical protein
MTSYLMEGELCEIFDRRAALIERMAGDLIAQGESLLTDGDAMRVLHHLGYASVDIAILAREARMVAFQSVVARAMSETDMDNTT